MEVWYVLFVREEPLRTCLDTIRVLYGAFTGQAHIVLRGPYRQRLSLAAADAGVRGQQVVFGQPRVNVQRGQQPVSLHVRCEGLERAWHRPGKAFDPALILYDGPSRADAVELYQVLTRFPLNLAFTAQGLEPLIAPERPTS